MKHYGFGYCFLFTDTAEQQTWDRSSSSFDKLATFLFHKYLARLLLDRPTTATTPPTKLFNEGKRATRPRPNNTFTQIADSQKTNETIENKTKQNKTKQQRKQVDSPFLSTSIGLQSRFPRKKHHENASVIKIYSFIVAMESPCPNESSFFHGLGSPGDKRGMRTGRDTRERLPIEYIVRRVPRRFVCLARRILLHGSLHDFGHSLLHDGFLHGCDIGCRGLPGFRRL